MDLKSIPPPIWAALITSLFVPSLFKISAYIKSNINSEFRINATWSKNNKNVLDIIEKSPQDSFAQDLALKTIAQSLILTSTNSIYKASRPKSTLPDWFCVVSFSIFAALAANFTPKPLNIFLTIVLFSFMIGFEISALLRSELNKQYRKFIRFSLLSPDNSKVLMENPEVSYIIFDKIARRSAYQSSPLISRNYSNWPNFWRAIKRTKVLFGKIFIFNVPENRYGIILKHIKNRQNEIYKNF